VYKELKESFNLLYPADMGRKDPETKPPPFQLVHELSEEREAVLLTEAGSNSTRKEFHSSLHSPDKQVLINKYNLS
jgi:hypothetical protein